MATGRLFVVATPIGNLEDITAHALRILEEVDLIAAEDTRRSRKLLARYAIRTPLTSYHDHNEAAKTKTLLRELQQGRDIALISNAGTPCVSDPGYRIVRAAHEHGIPVVSVPGPSAPIAALAVSGLPNDRFTFHGFLPRKQGEAERLLEKLAECGGTHLFFEAPGRLIRAMKRIAEAMPYAQVCVARELTKMFEEVVTGSPADVIRRFSPGRVKGECVVVLHIPAPPEGTQPSPAELQAHVRAAMEKEGLSRRDAVRQVAGELNLPRKQVYAAVGDDS